MRRRTGITLLELLVVLTMLGLLLSEALPRVWAIANASATRHAAEQVRTVLSLARERAVILSRPVAVFIDTAAASLAIGDIEGVISRHDVRQESGVRVDATRDSIAFSPLGLGWGASNVSVILTRGQSAETVTVSRMGRIR